MSARRVRRVTVLIDTLATHDPAFAAMDAVLLGMGYSRKKVSTLRRRRDGQVSGRIVWRKGGRSVVWNAAYQDGCL